MPGDAAATRARILAAAVTEFADHGLAGGRVAHIAAASRANPASLYAYYGSKEGLFDAAVTHALSAVGREVPVTPEDLPRFAVHSFDWLLAHPEAVRLAMWRNLEAPGAGPDDSDLYRSLVQQMTADEDCVAGALPPADLLVMVSGMALSWVLSSRDLLSADGRAPEDPTRIADYRASLAEAVRRLQASGHTARTP